jgi:hypothetical protein
MGPALVGRQRLDLSGCGQRTPEDFPAGRRSRSTTYLYPWPTRSCASTSTEYPYGEARSLPILSLRRGRVGNELGVVFDLAISAESWITSAFIMADVEELRSTCAEASS